MIEVNCKHWTDGECDREYYGGRPSAGVCLSRCPEYRIQNPEATTPDPLTLAVKSGESSSIKTLTKKAWTLAKALKSLATEGPVPLPVLQHRQTACTGRQWIDSDQTVVSDPCPAFKPEGESDGFCKACGCPEWSASKMSKKWKMPDAPCPRGHYSKANGIRKS